MTASLKKTIFIDIDGVLLRHQGNIVELYKEKARALPGVQTKIQKWHMDEHCIILVTARPECMRSMTEKDLASCGVVYDYLIMGVRRGPRVVINDMKPGLDEKMAVAINVERNVGLIDVEL